MVDYNPDPCISAAILFDLSPYRGGTTIKVYPPIRNPVVSRTKHRLQDRAHRSTLKLELFCVGQYAKKFKNL